MSIITVVYTRQGIVMASDSRLTRDIKLEDGSIERFTLTDNAEKIFLIKNGTIGISYCGDSEIEDNYIGEFIKKFDKEDVEVNDSIEEIADKLLKKTLNKGFKDTKYYICGYENEEMYIIVLANEEIKRLNIENTISEYSLVWNGFAIPISKIMNGEPPINIDFRNMQLSDAIEFSEFLIDLTIKYQIFEEGVATCGGPIDILVITKDYSKFIKHKILTK